LRSDSHAPILQSNSLLLQDSLSDHEREEEYSHTVPSSAQYSARKDGSLNGGGLLSPMPQQYQHAVSSLYLLAKNFSLFYFCI
jgi:hypothetical protein